MVQLLRGAAGGTLCRGCPGHLLVHSEEHLQHILTEYAQHYNHYRTPARLRPAPCRAVALTPVQVTSPLAGRPYDLRHAAVSLWLAAGVPPPRVAERAGRGVEVLLRVYAKCLDDGEDVANTCIDAALRDA